MGEFEQPPLILILNQLSLIAPVLQDAVEFTAEKPDMNSSVLNSSKIFQSKQALGAEGIQAFDKPANLFTMRFALCQDQIADGALSVNKTLWLWG